MSSYKRFEDLPVWQEAARLYNLSLDLLESHGSLFSHGFRSQLDRAALSVSNNIAEGFERCTTRELVAFLAIARGSAGEVRSMMAVIAMRRGTMSAAGAMGGVRAAADGCVRQLTGWIASVEEGPIQGKRHLTGDERRSKEVRDAAARYRKAYLLGLTPDHPVYHSLEAREARGEKDEEEGEGPGTDRK